MSGLRTINLLNIGLRLDFLSDTKKKLITAFSEFPWNKGAETFHEQGLCRDTSKRMIILKGFMKDEACYR
jgi:hypothetical protein